jgi:hypothetical protein
MLIYHEPASIQTTQTPRLQQGAHAITCNVAGSIELAAL